MEDRNKGLTTINLGCTVLNLCLAAFLGWSAWSTSEVGSSTDAGSVDDSPPLSPDPFQPAPVLVNSPATPAAQVPGADLRRKDTAAGSQQQSSARVRLPKFRLPMQPAALEAEARLVADILLEELPNDARSLHVAAVCRAQLRETKAAEELWLRCIELDSNGEPYYMNLAANFLNRGDSQEALDILEKARENGLNSADISHHIALALTNLGRDQEASAELERFLEIESAQGPHWLLLGQTQLKLRLPEQAQQSLLRAQELGVSSKPLYSALMNAAIQLKDKSAAASYGDELKQFVVDHPVAGQERYQAASEGEARRTLVSVLQEANAVYQNEKLWHQVEAINQRLIALDPSNLGPYRTLAEVYGKQSQFIDEFHVRERIMELEPQSFMNYLLAAKAASNAELFDQAESYLQLAISISPLSAVGYAAMGEFLLDRDRPKESVIYLNDALRREPSSGGYRLLARALRQLGKEVEAQAATDRARELN
ncbi:MAG: tetratricopeptide repeat protein [Aureliella sp.]